MKPLSATASLRLVSAKECRAKRTDKPLVASMAGNTEAEQACEYLYDRCVVAYPYRVGTPVDGLGAIIAGRAMRNCSPVEKAQKSYHCVELKPPALRKGKLGQAIPASI